MIQVAQSEAGASLTEDHPETNGSRDGRPVNGSVRPRLHSGPHDPFWLGKRLVELRKISPEQLQSAIEDFRRRPNEPFAHALERLSLASQKLVAQLMAERFGIKLVEIPPASLDPNIVKRLPQLRARNYAAVPCWETGRVLVVAVADPSGRPSTTSQRERFVSSSRRETTS
jgi:hypothetical protein